MRIFFRLRWIFLFIGWWIGGGRGALYGFLFGWLLEGMFSRPTVTFHFYTDTGSGRQQWGGGQQETFTTVNADLREAYSILGISETATDDEVRQAYRQLALRYHPDRVATQGEQAKASAEKIFQRINQAKETVFRHRGLK